MELIKVLRLRPTTAKIDSRLSSQEIKGTSYKGGVEDVRLEIYVEQVTDTTTNPAQSYDKFTLVWIKLFKATETGKAPEADGKSEYKNVSNRFGPTRQDALDFVLFDFILKNAYTELVKSGMSHANAESQSLNYYQIVQDPWQDNPPLQRNYGKDSYFLNNKTEVKVYWHIPGSQSVSFYSVDYGKGLTGGVAYSNQDGSETHNTSLLKPGNTPSVPFVQTQEDINFAITEKKKINKTIMAVDSSSGNQMFVLSSNEIKLYGTASEPDKFPGDVKDLDIITKFVDIWKIKVPNYELKLASPNYYPSQVDLEFKNPLGTPSSQTPSNDNQAVQSNSPEEVKFKLSVVYDDKIKIKAGENIPTINIYVGDPPKEGEFLFDEDEFDSVQLDDEFVEEEFGAEGEQILNLEQSIADQEEHKSLNNQNNNTNQDNNTNQNNNNANDIQNNTPGGVLNIKSTGKYTTELPSESASGQGKYNYGFNGVPYYYQGDDRWASVIYGKAEDGTFIEAKIPRKQNILANKFADGKNFIGTYTVTWEGKTYKIECDHRNGDRGYSTIAAAGCGVTSIAMIVNYYMIKSRKNIFTSPVKIAKMAAYNGGRPYKSSVPTCSGTGISDKFKQAIKAEFGITVTSINKSQVREYLKNKKPVLFCGSATKTSWELSKGVNAENAYWVNSPAGHYNVLTGIDDAGRIRANDPGIWRNTGSHYFSDVPSGSFWGFEL